MFVGFGDDLESILNEIMFDNTRSHFDALRNDYDKAVRMPLIELYNDLIPVVHSIDSSLCIDKRRCISSIYNDFRFSKNNPVKEYMYIKYVLLNSRKKDMLGFFIDFSITGVRYGLQLYKPTQSVLTKLLEPLNSCFENIGNEYKLYMGGSQAFINKAEELNILYNRSGNNPLFMISVNNSGTMELHSDMLIKNMTKAYYDLSDTYFILKDLTV